VRVHELAKELGVTSKELVATLEQMGAAGRSASSSVPEDLIPRLRASGGKATATTPKRREVLEPPPACVSAVTLSRRASAISATSLFQKAIYPCRLRERLRIEVAAITASYISRRYSHSDQVP
jgi:hypothetical protein